jgi:hypothetical protein
MVHPVMAEITLLRDIFVIIKRDRIIRAFIDAGPAAGAQVIIHDDNTVISFADGLFRAGFGTRWFLAVAAQIDLKYKFRMIIDPPRAVLPNRN